VIVAGLAAAELVGDEVADAEASASDALSVCPHAALTGSRSAAIANCRIFVRTLALLNILGN